MAHSSEPGGSVGTVGVGSGITAGANLAALTAAVVGGLCALAFVLVSRWSLGLEGFAPVAHVWSFWAISSAMITFSSSKVAVTATLGRRGAFRGSLPPAVALSLLLAWFASANRLELFGDTSWSWPILCALLPFGSLAIGVARGSAAGRNSTTQLFAVVAGENGLRVVSASLLAFLAAGSYAFALAIVVGFAASAVPLLAHRAREPRPAASPVDSSVAWAGSLAGLSAYSILVLGPTFLAVGGADAATVSVVFIVLAVYRAPFQITMGSAPRIMYLFEVSDRRPSAATPKGVMTLVLTASVVIGALVAVVGDWVLGSIFGIGGVMAPLDHSLAAVLSIVVTGAIVATLALMTTRIHTPVVVAWTIPAAIALTTLHLGGFAPTGTLLVLIVAALATLGALLRLWDDRDRAQPPSSI